MHFDFSWVYHMARQHREAWLHTLLAVVLYPSRLGWATVSASVRPLAAIAALHVHTQHTLRRTKT